MDYTDCKALYTHILYSDSALQFLAMYIICYVHVQLALLGTLAAVGSAYKCIYPSTVYIMGSMCTTRIRLLDTLHMYVRIYKSHQ